MVRLLDVVFREENQRFVIVCAFEYFENDLFGLVCRGVRFQNRIAYTHVFAEILKGVAHLHQQNLFHRDLKS